MNEDRNDQIDSSNAIQPEKTPLIVGPGIVIKGNIVSEYDDPDLRMLIIGRVEGDITTKGVVQIAKGAVVAANAQIEAGVIIVAGSITGEKVTIRANLLVLQATGNVAVDNVCLPSGGLEQQRGGILNARLNMFSAPLDQHVDEHIGQKSGQSVAIPFSRPKSLISSDVHHSVLTEVLGGQSPESAFKAAVQDAEHLGDMEDTAVSSVAAG